MLRYRDTRGRAYAGETADQVVADMHGRDALLMPKGPRRANATDYMRDVLWDAAQRGMDVDPAKAKGPEAFLTAMCEIGWLGEEV